MNATVDVPILRMQALAIGSMRDPGAVVAEAIDWTVNTGDYWVVAGLQGCGKTDFLMVAGGVMAPLSGQYWLLGEEMPIFDDQRLPQRLRLGFVFDGGQLFSHLTVRENIALPWRYHHNLSPAAAAEEVTRMLAAMELEPWAGSTPGAIGRNWQKRVGLARALMLRPEVLLIDNPLAGLDLPHLNWWLNLLGQLSRGHPAVDGRPITLVVTTADLRPWRGRARQFAVLKNRRLTVLGTWAQLEAASRELVHELLTAETPDG